MAYSSSTELFVEWAIGLVIIAIRFYARWTVGKRNFWWDDMCLGFVTVFWTFHTIFLYFCTDVYGSNIGLTTKTAMEVPDSQVPTLTKGSVYAFVSWLAYIFMVWSFKGVLMFLYTRLTMGLWQHRLAIGVGCFTICTFFTALFFHLFICYPVHKTWQIKPYAGDNCTMRPLNYIVIETISILTDLGIMSVPIPLVLAARIPKSQKILLCALFSSGIFVMIAAFLRAYYSVKDITTLSTALGWASREALVSVIIVSAPGIKPLITRLKWFRSYSGPSYTPGEGQSTRRRYGSNSNWTGTKRSNATGTMFSTTADGDNVELGMGTGMGSAKPRVWRGSAARCEGDNESQEGIVAKADGNGSHGERSDSSDEREGGKNGIMVTTDVMLEEEREERRERR